MLLPKSTKGKIWNDKINHVNNHPELFPLFVKPVEDKKFTGIVVKEIKDLIGCGSCYDNADVICSEVVDFEFECRGFVYYDKMIDLRPYKGDWQNMNKIDTKIIDNAMKDFATWKDRPNSCSLDWGVTKDGRTLLIEMNSSYSLGCYGLPSIYYAQIDSVSGVTVKTSALIIQEAVKELLDSAQAGQGLKDLQRVVDKHYRSSSEAAYLLGRLHYKEDDVSDTIQKMKVNLGTRFNRDNRKAL